MNPQGALDSVEANDFGRSFDGLRKPVQEVFEDLSEIYLIIEEELKSRNSKQVKSRIKQENNPEFPDSPLGFQRFLVSARKLNSNDNQEKKKRERLSERLMIKENDEEQRKVSAPDAL